MIADAIVEVQRMNCPNCGRFMKKKHDRDARRVARTWHAPLFTCTCEQVDVIGLAPGGESWD